MKEQTREDPKILAAAERQMQAWSMNSSIADRSVRLHESQEPSVRLHSYLTISRETGAGGSTIAKIVGRRLGWEVLDKELLDRIAQRYHSNRMMLDLVDETPSNWVYDVLGTWMDSNVIPHETYVAQLEPHRAGRRQTRQRRLRGPRRAIPAAARTDFRRPTGCTGSSSASKTSCG